MPKIRDEDLELESGFADDFDAAIVSARFGVREEYAKTSGSLDPMLILVLQGPELEQPLEQVYSIGGAKGWKAVKDGQEVISEKRPDTHKWNMSSRAGTLVKRLFELIGDGDLKKGQAFFKARDCYMTDAAFYTSLNCHWKREKMTTVGGEEREVLLPVAYLGEAKPLLQAPGIEDATDKLVILAIGKTDRELKSALLADAELKEKKNLLNDVFNKKLLERLEAEGRVAKDSAGRFVFKV